MPPVVTKNGNAAPLPVRDPELENSRLGVIYFLANLRVDFSAEDSGKDLQKQAASLISGKLGTSGAVIVAKKLGAVDAVDKAINQIAAAIQKWLVAKFNFQPSDVELAIQHIRYNLPGLISGIQTELGKSADSFGVTGIASGLYTGITKAIEFFDLRHSGKGVALESGHPDIVAASIQKSVAKSALVGLAEAALAGAKAALAALTHGVGVIINKVAGIIELLLRFGVRFCDALTLRKIFAEARSKWSAKGDGDAIQKNRASFAEWFKKTVDRSPVVAALVMNCGIAGDAMRFLQVCTTEGVVVTQGQFDKGVTFLTKLKSSAGDLIVEYQKQMKISSTDPMTGALLKHAGEIGLVQKEANSSWRARLFGWSHQGDKKGQALNWLLNKAGYKQSSVLA